MSQTPQTSQTDFSDAHYITSAELYIAYYTWYQYQRTAELTEHPELAILCYFRRLYILYIAYERNDFGYCFTHRHYYFGRHCPWNIRLRRNQRRNNQ